MAKEILTEELWAVMEPFLPPPWARPKGGRPRIPDRAVLTGIIFVLKTGLALLPCRFVPHSTSLVRTCPNRK